MTAAAHELVIFVIYQRLRAACLEGARDFVERLGMKSLMYQIMCGLDTASIDVLLLNNN